METTTKGLGLRAAEQCMNGLGFRGLGFRVTKLHRRMCQPRKSHAVLNRKNLTMVLSTNLGNPISSLRCYVYFGEPRNGDS